MPTYTIAIDWNDDGDFTDPTEDITADVLTLDWRLGLAAPHDSVPTPSLARITVRNRSGPYAPERELLPLAPGLGVRIAASHDLQTYTLFTGKLTHVEPQPGDQGARVAVLHVGGPESELQRHHVRLPPQINVRADMVIDAILDATPLRRAALNALWLVEVPGHAELDSTTYLASTVTIARSLEQGKSTFAYVADTWGDGIPALSAIDEVASSERGRFFVNRLGQAIFYHRHHTLLNTASTATFDDSMAALEYDYGASIINQVDVALTPRSIGTPGSVLWSLAAAQELLPGEAGVRRLIARYRDPAGKPCGALAILPPQEVIDYHANTAPDGSGTDRTDLVDMRLIQADAGSATVEFRNRSPTRVYLLAGAQLRGTPLYQLDPVTLSAVDYTSRNLYGETTLILDLTALDSVESADQLARFELSRRRSPRGIVASLALDVRHHLPFALSLSLFDRITVRESQTAHDADYFIIAEHHQVDLGGHRHTVTWTLEPALANTFWVLDTATLDNTATLAY